MDRQIYTRLVEWKEKQDRKPQILSMIFLLWMKSNIAPKP